MLHGWGASVSESLLGAGWMAVSSSLPRLGRMCTAESWLTSSALGSVRQPFPLPGTEILSCTHGEEWICDTSGLLVMSICWLSLERILKEMRWNFICAGESRGFIAGWREDCSWMWAKVGEGPMGQMGEGGVRGIRKAWHMILTLQDRHPVGLWTTWNYKSSVAPWPSLFLHPIFTLSDF